MPTVAETAGRQLEMATAVETEGRQLETGALKEGAVELEELMLAAETVKGRESETDRKSVV